LVNKITLAMLLKSTPKVLWGTKGSQS
jgi:hypothetical protein